MPQSVWPATQPDQVRENGIDTDTNKDVTFVGMEKDYALFEVGSGEYSFEVPARER